MPLPVCIPALLDLPPQLGRDGACHLHRSSREHLAMRFGPLGRLKIAQVAPLSESVPPKLYGGTERVVSVLTDELVRQGHELTLFASGDSQTAGTVVAPCAR